MRTRAVLVRDGKNGERCILAPLPNVKVTVGQMIDYHGESWTVKDLWSEPCPEFYKD